MIVKLLTEHHLEFLSYKGGCTDSSESIFVEMSNCWKSHFTAHMGNNVSLECLHIFIMHIHTMHIMPGAMPKQATCESNY